MKKMLKLTSFIMALAILVTLFTGCGQSTSAQTTAAATTGAAQAQTTAGGSETKTDTKIAPDWKGAKLTCGTLNPESNPDSMGAKWLADELNKKTDGRLVIDVYPASQLGNQSAQIDSLMMGNQDMFIGGMEPFAGIAKEFNALNIFFLFESQEQFQKFFQSQWYESAANTLASKNIVCINNAMNWVKGPFRIILSAKKTDGTLASVKGMKIRIPDQETFQKGFKALGMNPVVVALNETYLAMQQGTVDAVDLIPASIKSNSFQEVTKYIIKTDAFPQREGVFMSKKALESMPKEIQDLIYETADKAGDYYSKLVTDASDKVLKEIKDLGITYIDNADLSEWRAACKDLGYQFEQSGYLPKGITDSIKGMK